MKASTVQRCLIYTLTATACLAVALYILALLDTPRRLVVLVVQKIIDERKIPVRFTLKGIEAGYGPCEKLPAQSGAKGLWIEFKGIQTFDSQGRHPVSLPRLRLCFTRAELKIDKLLLWTPTVDLPSLSRVLRESGKVCQTPRSDRLRDSAAVLAERQYRVPLYGTTVIDAGVLIDRNLSIKHLSFVLKNGKSRDDGVIFSRLLFTAGVKSETGSKTFHFGPGRGSIVRRADGRSRFILTAPSPASDIDFNLAGNGDIRIDKFKLRFADKSSLKCSGSLVCSRKPPLTLDIRVKNIPADRIPLRPDIMGNLSGGRLSLDAHYNGPLLSPGKGAGHCLFSVERPAFVIKRPGSTKLLALDSMAGRIVFRDERLDLSELSVAGLKGLVTGTASVDFSSPLGVGWRTILRFSDVSLPAVADCLDIPGIERGKALGMLELKGGGGIPYTPSMHGITGYVLMKRLNVNYREPDRRMLFELSDARCEIRHDPPGLFQAFLRYGRLDLSGLDKSIHLPELSCRASVTPTGTSIDFLTCRLGKSGVLKIPRAIIPSSPFERANLSMELKNVETVFFDYLNCPFRLPPGKIDGGIRFSGVPRRLHEAAMGIKLAFTANKDEKFLKSFTGRFTIEKGRIALEGARALLLGGWLEAAGRGCFIGKEPTGRCKLALRGLDPSLLLGNKALVPHSFAGSISITRKEPDQDALFDASVSFKNGTETDISLHGKLKHAFSGRYRLTGSSLVSDPFDVRTDKAIVSLPGGLSIQYSEPGCFHLGFKRLLYSGSSLSKKHVIDDVDCVLEQAGRNGWKLHILKLKNSDYPDFPGTIALKGHLAVADDTPGVLIDLAADVAGSTIGIKGFTSLSPGDSKDDPGVSLDVNIEDPLPLWKAAGGRGPLPDGPLSFQFTLRPSEAEVKFRPFRLLLERKKCGRVLSFGSLSVSGPPVATSIPFAFRLKGENVVYRGPELRRSNGFHSIEINGTFRPRLLSLKSSRLFFTRGGTIELSGEFPLKPGVDGEILFNLKRIDLSAWQPDVVVDLKSGFLSVNGSFVGAWGAIDNSMIDFSLELEKGDFSASGLRPGPFRLSSNVSYKKGSVEFKELSLDLLGGTVKGQGKGVWDKKNRAIELHASFDGIRIQEFLRANTPGDTAVVPFEGVIQGELSAKNRGSLKSGFFGSGIITLSDAVIHNVSTVIPAGGRKFFKRFRDLKFSRCTSRIVLLKDTISFRPLNLRANFGSLDGWLKINRRRADVNARFYSNLSKKLIPSSFFKALASLAGGRYVTVGILLNGPVSKPKLRIVSRPGARDSFLGHTRAEKRLLGHRQ